MIFSTVTILVDNKSWILPYATELNGSLLQMGIDASLVFEASKIPEGEVCFFLGCTKLVSEEYLLRNKYNMVVHESDLPQGKGFAPMSWQILEGKNTIPFCLFEATSGADEGDIWIRDKVELSGYELNDEWRAVQGLKTIELCLRFVTDFSNLQPKPQIGKSTFYKRRGPKDSELDINKTIIGQFNLLRIVDNQNYPAFFYIDNQKYELKVTKCLDT